MKTVYKILILVGAIFALVGAMLTFIFLVNHDVFGLWSLFPLFFVALGICFIIPGIIDVTRTRSAVHHSVRQKGLLKGARTVVRKQENKEKYFR